MQPVLTMSSSSVFPLPRFLKVYDHTQRPDLAEEVERFSDLWPKLVFRPEAGRQFLSVLTEHFPQFVLYICDPDDLMVAVAVGVPLAWDENPASLPKGWTSILEKALDDQSQQQPSRILCALTGSMMKELEERQLFKYTLRAIKAVAARHQLSAVLAPVRPERKSDYPLIPIEQYVEWKNEDGSLFDPALRLHANEQASVLAIELQGAKVFGTVEEWESRFRLPFPDSGQYIVPGALTPITINRTNNTGLYVEPVVWMLHDLVAAPPRFKTQPFEGKAQ